MTQYDTSDPFLGDLLALLDTHRAMRLNHLATKASLPMKRLLVVLGDALNDGKVEVTDGWFHRPGELPTERSFATTADLLFNPQRSLAFGVSDFADAQARFEAMAALRPTSERAFHQYAVTARTALLRAYYLAYRGDLWEKHVVLLGDDDLTTFALLIVGGFRSLTVVELDPRLIAFLRTVIADHPTIAVVPHDLRAALPEGLRASADVVLSDPSRRLYQCFWDRSVEAVHDDGVIYTFASPSHGDAAGRFLMQRIALQAGWVISDAVPSFNAYEKESSSLTDEHRELIERAAETPPLISFTESLLRFTRGPTSQQEAAAVQQIQARS